MQWRDGWRRVTRVWRNNVIEDVDRELNFHFEQKIDEFVDLGMSADEARRRAVEEFGDVRDVRRSLREIDQRVHERQRRADWWETAAQDARYVLRSLRRSPGFTITVSLTLALGLGANATIFSLLDRLYFRPPDGVSDSAHVRRLNQAITGSRSYVRRNFNFTEVREMRAEAPPGLALAAFESARVRLGQEQDDPEVGVNYVEGDYFGVLGARPQLGRFFSSDEFRVQGLTAVAVIGYDVWKRHFAGDPQVVGKSMDLGSHRYTIVGVAQPHFRGSDLDAADVWVPLNTSRTWKGRNPTWYESPYSFSLKVLARIPNASSEQVFNARSTVSLRKSRLLADTVTTTYLSSIIEAFGDPTNEKELGISTRLAGVSTVILLIACANVVNLLLARAVQRRREIALRLAFGVSRGRLVAQLATEGLVLGLMAGLLSIGVAVVGANMLRTVLFPDIRLGDAIINGRLVWFTLGVALLTALVVGLAPALRSSRPDLTQALRGSARDGTYQRSRLRSALVMAQAALSMVLLTGAGAFVRSLHSIEAVDIGYAADRLVFATVSFDAELENRKAEIAQGMPDAVQRVRRIAGVESVALTSLTPLRGFALNRFYRANGDSVPSVNGIQAIGYYVSPDFFGTTGIRTLKGRTFTDADRMGTEPVIAVNETTARLLWPDEEAVGQCLRLDKPTDPCRRIVAVVTSTHYNKVIEDPALQYYVPLAQDAFGARATTLAIRAAPGQTARVGAQARRVLSESFGSWSRIRSTSMGEILTPQFRPWRMGAALFSSAGILALCVAALGVYSSVAYTIHQRAQEMGVRVALGAQTKDIMRLVIGEGVRVVAVGVVIGLVSALALGDVVASLLYHTSPRDPAVLLAAAVTLLSFAVSACLLPAWRASRVDPITSLRAE